MKPVPSTRSLFAGNLAGTFADTFVDTFAGTFAGNFAGASFAVLLAVVFAGSSVSAGAPSPENAPATVARTVDEASFNTVTLTAKAEERLRIKTTAVERKSVPKSQLFGGEIMVAFDESAADGSSTSQSILPLLDSMNPADRVRLAEAQVDADGVIAAAKVKVAAARVAMERAERMLRDKSGSQRAVDEARAPLRLAESELERAKRQRELLGPAALPGTTADRVWVRVSVYVGDLAHIDASEPARIAPLSASPDDPGVLAKPVVAPPSANAAAASADLFFALPNADGRFRLGERVTARLALETAVDSLVVPWASVIIDIYGGTWVYENTADHEFVRKRVQVERVAGDLAVLATGPAVGSKVVTDGAAELFGTEVGFSK